MSSERVACVACHHEIDAAAKLCPYCGADPRTGEKIDTEALMQEVFRPRQLSTSENVLEYARQRQGVVAVFAVVAAVLLLVGMHQFATYRNDHAVSSPSAVPLAEVTDVGPQNDTGEPPPPPPELAFQYDGNPKTMRAYVVEPGAVTPPEVVAQQQAAAQAAAQQKAAQAAAQAAAHPGRPQAAPTQPAPAGVARPAGPPSARPPVAPPAAAPRH